MGRWEPDARGRLAKAALTLYAEQGFDRTTVTEIAKRAGLTERTFFRHFADKREVLFHGSEMLREIFARTVAQAPGTATPIDAIEAALLAGGAMMQEDPERVRLRHTVVSANPELLERELVKLAALATVMAGALRERGVAEPVASLAAETGIAAFKVAFTRWVGDLDGADLPAVIRESVARLRDLLAESPRAETVSF